MISLQPNPARGNTVEVRVNGVEQAGCVIRVVDLKGVCMYSSAYASGSKPGNHVISVGEWPAGVYMITVADSAGVLIGKDKLIIGR